MLQPKASVSDKESKPHQQHLRSRVHLNLRWLNDAIAVTSSAAALSTTAHSTQPHRLSQPSGVPVPHPPKNPHIQRKKIPISKNLVQNMQVLFWDRLATETVMEINSCRNQTFLSWMLKPGGAASHAAVEEVSQRTPPTIKHLPSNQL